MPWLSAAAPGKCPQPPFWLDKLWPPRAAASRFRQFALSALKGATILPTRLIKRALRAHRPRHYSPLDAAHAGVRHRALSVRMVRGAVDQSGASCSGPCGGTVMDLAI